MVLVTKIVIFLIGVITLTKLFESIEPDKRQRIINAALDEFASKGCKQATTDNIVAKAGISKGALFKYFGNKEALLLFLCDYVYETVGKEYFDNLDRSLTDFFEIYSHSFKLKFEIISKHPSLFDFIQMLYIDRTEATDKWLSGKLAYAKEFTADTPDFDHSKFKDGLDIERAVNVVRLTFASFTNEIVIKLKTDSGGVDTKDIDKECDAYITFFKKIFYKGEA